MKKHISYKDKVYLIDGTESVLDCLLHNKVDYPHSCKEGLCQRCLTRVIDSNTDAHIDNSWQNGLTLAQKKCGLFLACQSYPQNDLTIALADDVVPHIASTILNKTSLNHNIMRIRLSCDERFIAMPGQYIILDNQNGIIRNYSIANNAMQDKFIELHIKLIDNGAMSNWMRNASVGDTVLLSEALGSCFYIAEDQKCDMILAGVGSGLAPLYGIANEALRQKHIGDIELLHGVLTNNDLYLANELTEMSKQHANFKYKKCILNSDDPSTKIDIQDGLVMALPDDKSRIQIFLCGDAKIVNSMKLKTFLSGVPSANIHSDPFL